MLSKSFRRYFAVFSNIALVRSVENTVATYGANVFVTCPPPVAISSTFHVFSGCSQSTSNGKSSPFAWLLLVTYLSAFFPKTSSTFCFGVLSMLLLLITFPADGLENFGTQILPLPFPYIASARSEER